MKQRKRLVLQLSFLLCFLFGINFGFAQERTIKGHVTDAADGSTIPGVSIQLKGTSTGAITGLDGNYTLKAPAGAMLVFSFVGYQSQEIAVTSDEINVKLAVEAKGLQEILVVGYGTVKKKDATGSVTSVSAADFNRGSISSPQELLVGKSAGVVITSSGGAPGANSTIRIRGGSSLNASNDPLIVVDGVPLDNAGISGMGNTLSTINPNDIETFTVLKDASATAIYGSRASNGVIIITTKKVKGGKAMKISYNGSISFSKAPKFVEVLSGDELRKLAIEKKGTNNIDYNGLTRLGTSNSDWQKEIFSSAISHDHNLSLGGTQMNIPYRISYGFTNQNGILNNTNMKRHTLSMGFDPTFFDKSLKVNINVKGMYSKNNFGNNDAVGAAVTFDPTQPLTNGNKRYAGYTTWTLDNNPDGEYNQMATANPLARCELTDNKSDVYRGIANLQMDYKMPFMPDLRANLNVGIDAYKSEGYDNADTTAMWTRRAGYGRQRDYLQEGSNKLIDFTLNYTKSLDAILSKIEVLGGYSWQHFLKGTNTNYERSIETPTHPLITADSTNHITENYLVSFFGRLNYNIADRYMFTFTVRDDGSSRFAKKNRWGIFPSAAFAWKIKEESFLRDVKAVTEFKLRLGWGVTGQQSIGNDYPYLVTYQKSQPSAQYQFGETWTHTLRPNAYDPDIKWETTTTQNIGLDLGFLNDRITASFELYKRVTDDLLNNIAIPNGSNFSNYLTTNVGSLENKGFEATLNLRPISTADFSWDIGFTLSANTNKITKLTRTDDPSYMGIATGGISGGTGNNIQIHSVGYPTNSFFVLQQVYNESDMPVEGLYVDRSGQGGSVAGNLANFYRYHKPAPDYLIGLSTRLSYKNFDFSMSGRMSVGNYVYNNIAAQTFYGNLYNNSFWQNISTQINDTKFNNAQYFSDFYLENGSFFKMDNISAGYNLGKIINDKISGRISFTVQNAFTVTKYKGLDPEVENGIDNNIYPRPRTFMFGLNLDF